MFAIIIIRKQLPPRNTPVWYSVNEIDNENSLSPEYLCHAIPLLTPIGMTLRLRAEEETWRRE